MRDRLSRAALILFEARAYDDVTVAQIAAEAGVTPRTFFRQFPEKREVLFSGSTRVRDHIVRALRDAPADLRPFDAVVHAMAAVGDLITDDDREWMQRRQRIVSRTPALEEREALKLLMVSQEITAVLRERGVDAGVAALVADLGVTVLNRTSRLWGDDVPGTYAELNARAAAEIWTVTRDDAVG